MQTQEASPTTVGGYRLIRSLGGGSRADVMLGAGTTGTVALKVLRPEVPDDDVGRELEALDRVPTEHCARLVDVLSTSAHHPVLAFERVHRGSVAQWLRDRVDITAGEAVTVLAPLASTLTRLHRAGVAHTNLLATNIHIGVAGEPVILGFGHAVLFDEGSSIAAIDARSETRSDRMQLAAIARLVLGAARPGEGVGAGSVQRLDDWLRTAALDPSFEFVAELEARLFDLAGPKPLEFARRGRGTLVVSPPGRGAGGQDPAVTVSEPAAAHSAGVRVRPVSPPDRLSALLDASPVQIARRMLLPAIASVRRPVWVVAGGIGVALVAALVLVPQGGGAQRARADAPLHQRATQATTSPTPQPAMAADAGRQTNPIDALGVLLGARADCFTARSVRCLSGVDDPASAALIADSAAVQRRQKGDEIPRGSALVAPAPRLVEQLGDSALVQLDARGAGAHAKPASVLMIRTKAGWRIRSYLSGKQALSG